MPNLEVNSTGRLGLTLIEIMIAVAILAFAMVPMSGIMTQSASQSKTQKCEVEALQFASDKMDELLMKTPFDDVVTTPMSATPIVRGDTQIKFRIVVRNVPVPVAKNFMFSYIDPANHPPCDNEKGEEKNSKSDLDTKTITRDITDLTIAQIDSEKVPTDTAIIAKNGYNLANFDYELKDIMLIVKWRPTNASDREYDRHPIVLCTRKARL